jgi:glutamyl-tRNA synthetase
MNGAADLLADAVSALDASTSWDADTLKATMEAVGAARGLKLGKAQAPVRVAVTGRSVGLPLFESLVVLGRDRTLARLRSALAKVAAGSPVA